MKLWSLCGISWFLWEEARRFRRENRTGGNGRLASRFLGEELGGLALDFALMVRVEGSEDLGCGNGHGCYSSARSWRRCRVKRASAVRTSER